ncbi:MAG: NADH:flavin oxidoreductase [Chitinophagales bacterium]|nr:NADH:flavin oxidoreductase [uncultured bacterium]
MPATKLNSPITFPSGKTLNNRFMLAPMTNTQSEENGQLSEDEYQWLVMRAKGGFGLVCTCASHVDPLGKGFPGQLGIFNDEQIEGHKRLSAGIQAEGSIAMIQLHHAGMRSPEKLIGEKPVCPSDNEETGARALRLDEVHTLRDRFVEAAVRAEKSGYDGVQIHGAHGYILCQFLSTEHNHRTDRYGGSLENRVRIIKEIIDGIRKQCKPNFILSLRLSPERMGMKLAEIKQLCMEFEKEKTLDFLDISLWDCSKMPEEEVHQDKTLLAHFTELGLEHTLLTVAGKISTTEDVKKILSQGVDFVGIGKSAILHHDFPLLVMNHTDFQTIETPVKRSHLIQEGLGEKFLIYMSRWPNFVQD